MGGPGVVGVFQGVGSWGYWDFCEVALEKGLVPA